MKKNYVLYFVTLFLFGIYLGIKELYLGFVFIFLLILFSLYISKTIIINFEKSMKRLQKRCKHINLRDYYVLFLEVSNLHIYSQFYDININDKIFYRIYQDLVEKLGNNNVFCYRSNQIVIISKHENNTILKTRNDEQYRLCKEIINYISKKHYYLDNSGNYYSANLTIGSGSMGIINQEKDIDSLVKLAYFSMIKAKEKGIDILIGDDEIRTIKKDLDNFYLEIEKGFKLDEFSPYFLPILNPKTLQIIGCESLVRWNKDKYRVIEASKFKDIALEKNLFEKIDKRVIDKTLQAYTNWLNNNLINNEFKICINLSKATLLDLDTLDLTKTLKNYEMKPENIEFDIALSEEINEEEIEAIKHIKQLGFKIAIDLVSSEPVTLSLLGTLNVDTIKIGQFNRIKENEYKLYRTLSKVSKIMNFQTMAKGIESKRDLDLTKRLSIDFVQGYYFSKPLNEEGFQIFLNKYQDSIIQ